MKLIGEEIEEAIKSEMPRPTSSTLHSHKANMMRVEILNTIAAVRNRHAHLKLMLGLNR